MMAYKLVLLLITVCRGPSDPVVGTSPARVLAAVEGVAVITIRNLINSDRSKRNSSCSLPRFQVAFNRPSLDPKL